MVSVASSQRDGREKRKKNRCVLCLKQSCAVLWDQGKHILFTVSKLERHHYQNMLEKRYMAGKTGREKMHWSVNKHIHTFSHTLSFFTCFHLQADIRCKEKLFPTKINKVAMKDKCTKKDIQRISQHISKTQTNSCIETFCSAAFHVVDVDGIVGKSTAPFAADIVLWQSVYWPHIVYLCSSSPGWALPDHRKGAEALKGAHFPSDL